MGSAMLASPAQQGSSSLRATRHHGTGATVCGQVASPGRSARPGGPPRCSPPCMGKPPPAPAHASSRDHTAPAPPAPAAAARPPACPQHRRCCQQAGAVSCTLTPAGLSPGVNRQACTHERCAPGAGARAVTRRAEQPSATSLAPMAPCGSARRERRFTAAFALTLLCR